MAEATRLGVYYSGEYDNHQTSPQNPNKVWILFDEIKGENKTGNKFFSIVTKIEFDELKLKRWDRVEVNRLGKLSKVLPARSGN